MRHAFATIVCLVVGSWMLGCAATPTTPPPPAPTSLTFEVDERPAVHQAAVEVLRQQGFRIARDDYRFGTITTYPKESATIAEFWIDDATTFSQRRSDTLNAQQRAVALQVQPTEDRSAFFMTVSVTIQRLQRPARFLTHSATGQLSAEYAATPLHLSESGIDGPYTVDLGRDTQLESRLVNAIRAAIE